MLDPTWDLSNDPFLGLSEFPTWDLSEFPTWDLSDTLHTLELFAELFAPCLKWWLENLLCPDLKLSLSTAWSTLLLFPGLSFLAAEYSSLRVSKRLDSVMGAGAGTVGFLL